MGPVWPDPLGYRHRSFDLEWPRHWILRQQGIGRLANFSPEAVKGGLLAVTTSSSHCESCALSRPYLKPAGPIASRSLRQNHGYWLWNANPLKLASQNVGVPLTLAFSTIFSAFYEMFSLQEKLSQYLKIIHFSSNLSFPTYFSRISKTRTLCYKACIVFTLCLRHSALNTSSLQPQNSLPSFGFVKAFLSHCKAPASST